MLITNSIQHFPSQLNSLIFGLPRSWYKKSSTKRDSNFSDKSILRNILSEEPRFSIPETYFRDGHYSKAETKKITNPAYWGDPYKYLLFCRHHDDQFTKAKTSIIMKPAYWGNLRKHVFYVPIPACYGEAYMNRYSGYKSLIFHEN